MLRLFRSGEIVPGSYNNLRESAVEEIENWVLSWIHRKIIYENLVEEEKSQRSQMKSVVDEIEQYYHATLQ